MKHRSPTFNFEQHRWIRYWRNALRRHNEKPASLPPQLWGLDLGDRARMRRATSGVELSGDPAVHLLAEGLIKPSKGWRAPEDTPRDYYRLGIVAGVLALVDDLGTKDREGPDAGDAKRPAGETLARSLGRGADGGVKLSEIRFRQLRTAIDPEVLLRLWRRAVVLAGKRVDAAFLADDLYTWLVEIDTPRADPVGSVRFHWAYDYYQQPRDKETGGESTPDAEAVA